MLGMWHFPETQGHWKGAEGLVGLWLTKKTSLFHFTLTQLILGLKTSEIDSLHCVHMHDDGMMFGEHVPLSL